MDRATTENQRRKGCAGIGDPLRETGEKTSPGKPEYGLVFLARLPHRAAGGRR